MNAENYNDMLFSIYEENSRYIEDDKPCKGCHKLEDSIDDLADCFTELVRQIYGETSEINIYDVDRILYSMKNLLSEHVLNVTMPDSAPTIKRNIYQGEAA